MKIVVPHSNFVFKLLGEQQKQENECYRKIKFHKIFEVDEGFLVFNALTEGVILLSNTEFDVFEGRASDYELTEYLIKNWFFVPEANDDLLLSRQVSELSYIYGCSRIGMPQNSFVILPTTDCNARCFYCYELAGNRRNMSEQTAHDVADFIEKKRNPDRPVTIRWFGGEPLYNATAMDIICNDLSEKKIEFSSTMVSNGYLFDEEMVARAVNCWRLKHVQITLDGTEEIYNRIKAYIYKGVNAFQKVIRNIKLLLDADVSVNIRMNMDDHNEADLFELTDYLMSEFKGYEKLKMYPHLLFEDSCARISARAEDERHHLIEAQVRLRNLIDNKHNLNRSVLRPSNRFVHCMADSDGCALILPDGKLGKCQHFTDDRYYGSIYSDEIDVSVIEEFKKTDVVDPSRCPDCELHPYCLCLKSCLIVPRRCDEYDKKFKLADLEIKVRNAYDDFKNKEK